MDATAVPKTICALQPPRGGGGIGHHVEGEEEERHAGDGHQAGKNRRAEDGRADQPLEDIGGDPGNGQGNVVWCRRH